MPLHRTFRQSLVSRITSYSVDRSIETTALSVVERYGL
jgi:hypothetical protein